MQFVCVCVLGIMQIRRVHVILSSLRYWKSVLTGEHANNPVEIYVCGYCESNDIEFGRVRKILIVKVVCKRALANNRQVSDDNLVSDLHRQS